MECPLKRENERAFVGRTLGSVLDNSGDRTRSTFGNETGAVNVDREKVSHDFVALRVFQTERWCRSFKLQTLGEAMYPSVWL